MAGCKMKDGMDKMSFSAVALLTALAAPTADFRSSDYPTTSKDAEACAAAGSEVSACLGTKMLPREQTHVRDALLKRVHAADRACDAAWLACFEWPGPIPGIKLFIK